MTLPELLQASNGMTLREILKEVAGAVLLYPFTRNRRRRYHTEPEPYIHGPSSAFFLQIDSTRLALTRTPSPTRVISEVDAAPQSKFCIDDLPVEIRQAIWQEVIGGQIIHLEYQYDHPELQAKDNYHPELRRAHLVGYECVSSDPSNCKQYHDGGCCVVNWENRPVTPKVVTGKLALLMACKRIYRESIDLLYSSNTFVLYSQYDMMNLDSLPFTLLPQRFNTIRTLRLCWRFYNHPPLIVWVGRSGDPGQEYLNRGLKWKAMWKVLSEMEGLQNLDVELMVGLEWETLNKECAKILLAPIKKVTRPQNFVLRLPFRALWDGMPPDARFSYGATQGWEGSDPWDDLGCTIVRLGENH